VNLTNTKLIGLIPELLDLPHVHIDAVALVLYYGIMYCGCTMDITASSEQGMENYARSAYIGCLRALPHWQRESSGSEDDFIASLLMVKPLDPAAGPVVTVF
jgi:hypothetical protein